MDVSDGDTSGCVRFIFRSLGLLRRLAECKTKFCCDFKCFVRWNEADDVVATGIYELSEEFAFWLYNFYHSFKSKVREGFAKIGMVLTQVSVAWRVISIDPFANRVAIESDGGNVFFSCDFFRWEAFIVEFLYAGCDRGDRANFELI